MRGFSDSLPLSARITTAYNAGEMCTGALSERENWSLSVVIFHTMDNSCCANCMDVRMRGFPIRFP